MCEQNNVPLKDACRFIFSGITLKKATELFKLPREILEKNYNFETRQNRDRISLKQIVFVTKFRNESFLL